ncbi:MAG: ABC transporter superfamily protein [Amphiamblys sp. WSBS2006]|nr:MAG: ABC transporter superfamily protein [Amphiamblys sp. WSBS2006]
MGGMSRTVHSYGIYLSSFVVFSVVVEFVVVMQADAERNTLYECFLFFLWLVLEAIHIQETDWINVKMKRERLVQLFRSGNWGKRKKAWAGLTQQERMVRPIFGFSMVIGYGIGLGIFLLYLSNETSYSFFIYFAGLCGFLGAFYMRVSMGKELERRWYVMKNSQAWDRAFADIERKFSVLRLSAFVSTAKGKFLWIERQKQALCEAGFFRSDSWLTAGSSIFAFLITAHSLFVFKLFLQQPKKRHRTIFIYVRLMSYYRNWIQGIRVVLKEMCLKKNRRRKKLGRVVIPLEGKTVQIRDPCFGAECSLFIERQFCEYQETGELFGRRGVVSYYCGEYPRVCTARENILFHEEYDEKRYREVLCITGLDRIFKQRAIDEDSPFDFFFAPHFGRLLGIGRCLYKKADIYLFNNPFHSIESDLVDGLAQKCFIEFLRGKTVFIQTNIFFDSVQFDAVVQIRRRRGRKGERRRQRELGVFSDFSGRRAPKPSNEPGEGLLRFYFSGRIHRCPLHLFEKYKGFVHAFGYHFFVVLKLFILVYIYKWKDRVPKLWSCGLLYFFIEVGCVLLKKHFVMSFFRLSWSLYKQEQRDVFAKNIQSSFFDEKEKASFPGELMVIFRRNRIRILNNFVGLTEDTELLMIGWVCSSDRSLWHFFLLMLLVVGVPSMLRCKIEEYVVCKRKVLMAQIDRVYSIFLQSRFFVGTKKADMFWDGYRKQLDRLHRMQSYAVMVMKVSCISASMAVFLFIQHLPKPEKDWQVPLVLVFLGGILFNNTLWVFTQFYTYQVQTLGRRREEVAETGEEEYVAIDKIEFKSVTVKSRGRCLLWKLSMQISRMESTIVFSHVAEMVVFLEVIFRITSPETGDVFFNDSRTDIASDTIRRSIAVVFSESCLLLQRLRVFLDKERKHSDEVLWGVLDEVGLAGVFRKKRIGLDTFIGMKGVRLTQHQEALLMLAFFFLHRPSMLFIANLSQYMKKAEILGVFELVHRLFSDIPVVYLTTNYREALYSEHLQYVRFGILAETGSPFSLRRDDGSYLHSFLKKKFKTEMKETKKKRAAIKKLRKGSRKEKNDCVYETNSQ